MGKINVIEFQGREGRLDWLTGLLRTYAEQLIYQAVEAEFKDLLAELPSGSRRVARREWCKMAISTTSSGVAACRMEATGVGDSASPRALADEDPAVRQ